MAGHIQGIFAWCVVRYAVLWCKKKKGIKTASSSEHLLRLGETSEASSVKVNYMKCGFGHTEKLSKFLEPT